MEKYTGISAIAAILGVALLYPDVSLSSAPSPTQMQQINSIIAPFEQKQYSAACATASQVPVTTFSCDGFPAWNPNNCPGLSIFSPDGYNTSTNVGTPQFVQNTQNGQWVGQFATFMNGTQSLSNTSTVEYRSYDIGGGGTGGYICREFGTRYFHFRWNIDPNPDSQDAGNAESIPCGIPAVPGTTVASINSGGTYANATVADGNTGASTTAAFVPVPGDVVVYSQSWGPFTGGGHVAVVFSVDPISGTVINADQNFGSAGQANVNGYDVEPINNACTYVHAVKNTNTADTCVLPDHNAVGGPYALANYYTGPAAGLDSQIKEVVFIRAADGNIYYKAETAPNSNGAWDPAWTNLTTPVVPVR